MAPSSDIAPAPMPSPARRTALWVLVVQCLLALSWTMYVLFLPAMLDAVGIARRWFVYVLMFDQLVFAACDWAAGVYVDRIATTWRRAGRAITAVTLLSSAALLAMPWVAAPGNAPLLLVVIFFWAATSSALRAPVFALLGRIREAPGRAVADGSTIGRRGGISLGLVGIALAGAVGPYMTLLLKGVDSRLPIAISALALAAAGLWATRVEESLPPPVVDADVSTEPAVRRTRRVWALVVVMLIAGFGTQVVLPLVAQPLLRSFVGDDAMLWIGAFWVAFAIGLVPGTRIASMTIPPGRSLAGAAIALLVSALALAAGIHGGSLAFLVISLVVAGGAWGLFTTVVFAAAVALSDGRATVRGAGTASGLLFSAIAIGTLMRLGCVAAGWSRASLIVWVPSIAWIVGGVLLIVFMRTLWHPRVAQA